MHKLFLIPLIVSVIIIFTSIPTSNAEVTLDLTSKQTKYGWCEDLDFTVYVHGWDPKFPVLIQTKIINWDNNWGYTGYEYPETIFNNVFWKPHDVDFVKLTIDFETLPTTHGTVFWESTAILLPIVTDSNYKDFHLISDTVKFITYPHMTSHADHGCNP